MAFLLGVDIGTSATKTVLFDEKGNSLAVSQKEYPLYQPQIGWAEQEPEDWWNATCETIRDVIQKSGVPPHEIKGIGLSGQMHGAVLLDDKYNVLRRAIIWCDQRSYAECEQITSLVGKNRLVEITANPALTGFTASKILWVRNHEPHIYQKIKKILLPKDYIRFKLTGEFATEVSDASGMQLLDIPQRRWSDEVLSQLEIERSFLGDVYESIEVSGRITRQAAELTGLMTGTPVVGGAGDQAAGAVGNGIVMPGVVSSTIGTSGVVFAVTDKVNIDFQGRVHTFCHAVPNTWHIMGVTQAAGLSLRWFRDNFCFNESHTASLIGVDPYSIMEAQAANSTVGCDGLIYLPYLMGERTPHIDPDAKGVFFGLSARHTKADLIRAVMEGVVYSLRDCLEIIEQMSSEILEVRASGGGAKSTLWRQMQSDVFGKNITTVSAQEGPALGVALLAGVGTGVYRNVQEACENTVMLKSKEYPDMKNYEKYSRFYEVYKNLYKSLNKDFKDLAGILK